MEDQDQLKSQFEFNARRAITEAAPHRAACRYDSAEEQEEDELAISGEFFDLNQLPDYTPLDLYQHQTSLFSGQVTNSDHYTKPLKPQGIGTNLPNKVFKTSSNSCYNSSKNLRNQANNRYSSQNLKNQEYDDENEHEQEHEDQGLDIAEENFTMTSQQVNRRGSQRYKDRVKSLRVQSQETCYREGGKPISQVQKQKDEEQEEEDSFDIFERADQRYNKHALTEHNQEAFKVEPKTFYQQEDRWMTQQQNEDQEAQFDSNNGAHFQYQELLYRLSDISHSKKEKVSSMKKYKQGKLFDNQDAEMREPLKETTQDAINKQLILSAKKHTPKDKSKIYGNSIKSKNSHEGKKKFINIPSNQVTQNKITKLLKKNQENNFVDRKLKEQQKKKISKNSQLNHNKSQATLHKSNEKGAVTQKVQQIVNQQVNNIKIKPTSNTDSIKNSQGSLSGKINVQKIQQSNNLLQNTIMSSSTNSTQGLGLSIKCSSNKFLKTQPTGVSNSITKSSVQLTQSSSNKQIMKSKETPESTCRQAIRLTGTTLSSTSKKGITTLSNGSQGNTIQVNTNFQTITGQHDSITKKNQSSEQKQTHPSIANISNSNQKVELKKMMIKNNSFLKTTNSHNAIAKQQNDFYQTIYQKIQNNNFILQGNSQIIGGQLGNSQNQIKLSASKNSQNYNKPKKIKVQSQRMSGQGSNHASINSPDSNHRVDIKSIQSSPSQSFSRKTSQNARENIQLRTEKAQPQNTQYNRDSFSKVNYMLKKLQDNNEPLLTSQRTFGNSQVQQQQQQQSILLQHQIKNSSHQSKLFSGKYQRNQEQFIQRQNSSESVVKQQIDSINIDQQNKNSFIEQQQKITENKQQLGVFTTACLKQQDKIGKFLAQKQYESSKNHIKQSQPNININKGLLLSNIMLQKATKLKNEMKDRQHLHTEVEEDGNMMLSAISKLSHLCNGQENSKNQNKEIPPLSGQRLSQLVKIKAKNF